jgi:hypothetical protein
MNRYPSFFTAYRFAELNESAVEINGRWVAARPLGFCSFYRRIKGAWLVFTGRADVLLWPGQES